MNYIFDGSYGGFLTAIFESFERKHFNVNIIQESHYQPTMFDEGIHITYDIEKNNRVKKGIFDKGGAAVAKDCFRCFLSEQPEALNVLFRLIQRLFKEGPKIFDNYGDSDVLLYHQTIKKVGRERHRMQAFIRFQNSSDGLFYATVEPDFNVLPLLITFFKNRYRDQPWLIYDLKRNYGIHYNLNGVHEVQLTEEDVQNDMHSTIITLNNEEKKYQDLWKLYFKSTNIVERKNMKLHLRHVPRRYWKYLTEKQT